MYTSRYNICSSSCAVGFDDYGGGGMGSGDDRAVHSASPGAHSNNLGRAGTVRKNINR